MLTAVVHISDIKFLHDTDTDGVYIEDEEILEIGLFSIVIVIVLVSVLLLVVVLILIIILFIILIILVILVCHYGR